MPLVQPIRDRRIRFALVGCGRISANHLQAISTHAERAELVAVCDSDPAALAAAAQASGAHDRCLSTISADPWAGSDCAAAQTMTATPSAVFPRQACYLAQQAAEKALKAMLIALDIDFPKTHDLLRLRTLVPATAAVYDLPLSVHISAAVLCPLHPPSYG